MSDSIEPMAEASAGADTNPANGAPAADAVDWKALVPRIPRKPDGPPPAEMTVGQAAEHLDVPRSYIVKRVRKGELPCRMVKKRRRIPKTALDEERERISQRARAAADEMSRIAQELGLYEEELGKKAP